MIKKFFLIPLLTLGVTFGSVAPLVGNEILAKNQLSSSPKSDIDDTFATKWNSNIDWDNEKVFIDNYNDTNSAKIYEHLSIFYDNLPSDMQYNDVYSPSIINMPTNTTSKVKIGIKKYYDEKGNIKISQSPQLVKVIDMVPGNYALNRNDTQMVYPKSTSYPIPPEIKGLYPYEVTNVSNLKNFVKHNFFINAPDAFDFDLQIVGFNNPLGYIYLKILNPVNFYHNGVLTTNASNLRDWFPIFFIRGLRQSRDTTTIKRWVFNATYPINKYSTDFYKEKPTQQELIRQWIYDHRQGIFDNLPNNFPLTNLKILDTNFNNDNSIDLTIELKDVKNGGSLSSIQFQIKINSFPPCYVVQKSNALDVNEKILSSQLNIESAKELLYQNRDLIFKYYGNSDLYDWNNNLVVNSITPNPNYDEVFEVNYTLKSLTDNKNDESYTINFYNFHKINTILTAETFSATTPINQYAPDYYLNNKTQYDLIKQWVFNNKDTMFKNLPDNFSINDIKSIEGQKKNATTLTINLLLNNVYKDTLISNNVKFTFDVTDFSSYYIESFTNSANFGLSHKYSDELKNADVKELIINNKNEVFKTYGDVSNFDWNSNLIINRIEQVGSNRDTLRAYYDLYKINTINQKINNNFLIISGFKKKTTELNKEQYMIDYPLKKYAPDYFIQNEGKKSDIINWIFANKDIIFTNLPNNFQMSDITSIHLRKKDNQTLNVSLVMNNVYVTGQLKNNITFNFDITGFATYYIELKTNIVKIGIPNKYNNQVLNSEVVDLMIQHKDEVFAVYGDANNFDWRNKLIVNNIRPTGTLGNALIVDFTLLDNNSFNNSLKNEVVQLTGFRKITTELSGKRIIASAPINQFCPDYYMNNISEQQNIKEWVYENRTTIFSKLPESFGINDISSFQISKNDSTSINVKVKLNNIYDNGVIISNVNFSFIIYDFSLYNIGVERNNVDIGDSTRYSDELDEDEVKQLIIENYNLIFKIYGSIDDFNWQSNLKINRISQVGSNRDTLNVYFSLTNSNSFNSTLSNVSIIINGFKKRTTELQKNIFNATNPIKQYTPDYFLENANEQTMIKQWIFDNRTRIFTNVASFFTIDSITNLNINKKDKNTLGISLNLNQVYSNGELVNNVNFTFDITAFSSYYIDFKKNLFDFGDSTKYSDEINGDEIKELILKNKSVVFKTYGDVSNFDWNSNISIINYLPVGNLKDSLLIDVKISNSNSFSNSIIKKITLNGFKKITTLLSAQTFESTNPIKQYSPDYLVQNSSQQPFIKQWIFNNRSKIFVDLTSSFTIQDIISLSLRKVDDTTLNITVVLNNVYKSGEIVNGQSFSFNVVGFSIYYIDVLDQNINIGINNKYSDKVTSNEVEELMIQNINKIFKVYGNTQNYNWERNIVINRLIPIGDNRDTLKVIFTLNNSNSFESKLNSDITLTGFKKRTTELRNNNFVATDPIKQYSPDYFLDNLDKQEIIKQWIYDNRLTIFDNMPINFRIGDISSLGITKKDNSSLNINVIFNNVYVDGTLSNNINFSFTISNFSTYYIDFINVPNKLYPLGDPEVNNTDAKIEYIKKQLIANKDTFFKVYGELPQNFSWENNLNIINFNPIPDSDTVSFNIQLKNKNSYKLESNSSKILFDHFFRKTNTILLPNVEANGIKASMPIMKFPVQYWIDNKDNLGVVNILKKWIIDNLYSIINYYGVSDISINEITDFKYVVDRNDENSLDVTMTLKNAVLDYKVNGEKVFNFKITNFSSYLINYNDVDKIISHKTVNLFDVNNENIKNIIIDNIKNIFDFKYAKGEYNEQFWRDNINVKIVKVNRWNNIKVEVSLSKYFEQFNNKIDLPLKKIFTIEGLNWELNIPMYLWVIFSILVLIIVTAIVATIIIRRKTLENK